MSLKETLFNKVLRIRNLFLWGNIVLLVLLGLTALQDNERGWKEYQSEYKAREIARAKALLAEAKTEEEKAVAKALLTSAKRQRKEITQIWIEDTEVVDRCITCHQGFDSLNNSSMTTEYEDHPFRAPDDSISLEIHKAHDVQKYGCVVCHGGQGYATETEAAHGKVHHWEKPLLTGVMLQASCKKCHDNLEELQVKGQVYPSEVIRAEELFKAHGCIGCHQIGGEGGPISVDLQAETSMKPLSRIDFAYTGLPHEERTLENWIKLHFIKDPAEMVPGDPKGEFNTEPIPPSGMPPYLMPEKDANALTAFILGLNRSGIPPEHRVDRPPKPEPKFYGKIQWGRYVYDKYGCAGCHGAEARGGVRNYNYTYDVSPNLRGVVSTYTTQELKEKIRVGVPIVAKLDAEGPNPPLYMPAWKDKISEPELDALVTYLFSIRE